MIRKRNKLIKIIKNIRVYGIKRSKKRIEDFSSAVSFLNTNQVVKIPKTREKSPIIDVEKFLPVMASSAHLSEDHREKEKKIVFTVFKKTVTKYLSIE